MKILLMFTLLFSLSEFSFAKSDEFPLVEIEIPQNQQTLKRGATIYYNLCRLCHDMKYIRYAHLKDIGFTKQEIDKLRGSRMATETLKSTISKEHSANLFGMVAPDLSVMAKARNDGARYIYTLLTSYYVVSDTAYDNKLFPNIRMPDAFSYSIAENKLAKTEIENRAKDVSAFLLWASDPKAEERKSLGVYVISYLLLLTVMFYFLMKRIWARLD